MSLPSDRVRGIPIVLAIAFALAWSGAAPALSIYDFESLAIGALDGQDGWTKMNAAFGTAYVAVGSGPPNSTQVLEPGHTPAPPTVYDYYRNNNASWSFTPFSGLETAAYIQFDCVVDQSSAGAMPGSMFRVGGSPQVIVGDNWPATGLTVPYWRVRTYAGTNYVTPIDLTSEASIGDWVRVRLMMDLTDTTGGNQGTMSLFFMNLTTGGPWTDVAALQGLDMELVSGGSAPSTWSYLDVRVDSPDLAPLQRVDNLVVGGQVAIPEPTTLTLLALGGLGLLARRRRKP